MAEIVEELFNEFPEFNKNPGKLKEALNCLIDSKPNIKISTTFKKNLKSRIDNIISLKCKRKFNFFHIFASTFAFFIFLL
ncbi:MAG: hypothetical protein LBC61_04910 [Candidatus Peribacteria bacterium]|jgi:hypothetical protein|nr:hypothetical protein [Candidatus Peribacteria bacterium]